MNIENVKSTIRLFNGVLVTGQAWDPAYPFLNFYNKTVKHGYVLTDRILKSFGPDEINDIIGIINKEIGLSGKEMNSSFHKSWKKIKEASLEQLFLEQIIHYFTTYGFEELGCYSAESIYIPNEELNIPVIEDKIKLKIINCYSKSELKEKLLKLLSSGIALKEQTLKDVKNVALSVDLNIKDFDKIKNKEARIILGVEMGISFNDPVDFLRQCVYKVAGTTLLIKSKDLIADIKEKIDHNNAPDFSKYSFGLTGLSKIFYRYKPIFLALKTGSNRRQVNNLRRLAKKHHVPLVADYLNDFTNIVKRDSGFNGLDLIAGLEKVNIFRKIRLLYSLTYKICNHGSALYKIRNGKSWATRSKFNHANCSHYHEAATIIYHDIVENFKYKVNEKKFYIPENIKYSLPSSEKQFTGNFPSGTSVVLKDDMIFGVWWKDIEYNSVDLDLSIINSDGNKIGWDGEYRNDEKTVLFSGDVTAAPNGASELFYVNNKANMHGIVMLNYYNFNKDLPVPYKIMIASERPESFDKNYLVNPNNMTASTQSILERKQKVIGLVSIENNECRFYFSEFDLGGNITSSNSEYAVHARNYLNDYYKNMFYLNELITNAGGILVDNIEKCDIDLSPESLDKNTIIDLLI